MRWSCAQAGTADASLHSVKMQTETQTCDSNSWKHVSETPFTRVSAQTQMKWNDTLFFCCFFFFSLWGIFAVGLPEVRGQGPGPPGAGGRQGQLSSSSSSSRRPAPLLLAAGPSPSGEPLESWRCGVAGPRGGPGAAGSPWWGWGPCEEAGGLIKRASLPRVHACLFTWWNWRCRRSQRWPWGTGSRSGPWCLRDPGSCWQNPDGKQKQRTSFYDWTQTGTVGSNYLFQMQNNWHAVWLG